MLWPLTVGVQLNKQKLKYLQWIKHMLADLSAQRPVWHTIHADEFCFAVTQQLKQQVLWRTQSIVSLQGLKSLDGSHFARHATPRGMLALTQACTVCLFMP